MKGQCLFLFCEVGSINVQRLSFNLANLFIIYLFTYLFVIYWKLKGNKTIIRILIILPFFKPLAVFGRVSEKHLAAVLRHITSWTIGRLIKKHSGLQPRKPWSNDAPIWIYSQNFLPIRNQSHWKRVSNITLPIELSLKGAQSIQGPQRLGPEKLQIAKSEFNTLLELWIIQPSLTSWSSPLHMALKETPGTSRPWGDCRALNYLTVPDCCRISYIQQFTSSLLDATSFSKIDLVRTYHQIPVDPKNVYKTTITTPFGLFEFRRMPFGLRDAAETCKRFMDQVICRLNFVYCYIDDLQVASSSSEEHKQRARQLFNRLREYGLLINPGKCEFGRFPQDFLDHRMSKTGIRPLIENISHLWFPTTPIHQEV